MTDYTTLWRGKTPRWEYKAYQNWSPYPSMDSAEIFAHGVADQWDKLLSRLHNLYGNEHLETAVDKRGMALQSDTEFMIMSRGFGKYRLDMRYSRRCVDVEFTLYAHPLKPVHWQVLFACYNQVRDTGNYRMQPLDDLFSNPEQWSEFVGSHEMYSYLHGAVVLHRTQVGYNNTRTGFYGAFNWRTVDTLADMGYIKPIDLYKKRELLILTPLGFQMMREVKDAHFAPPF